jgi:hypothetical protein
MSTLVLFIGALLTGQVSQPPADSRYSGSGGVYPLAIDRGAATSLPNGNNSNTSAGALAQPINGSTSGTQLPGPPERLGSAYSGSSATVPPLGSASGPLGGEYSAVGSSSSSGTAPLSGSNSFAPIGSSATPLTNGTAPRSNPPAVASSGGVLKPTGMMRAMMEPHANSRLSGEWISLEEIIIESSPRGDQARQIEAYWDLCSSVADYFLGLREQEEIRRLRGLFPNAGAALQQAEQQLSVRVGTAERAARVSQLRLASLTNRGSDRLPLPADQPFCGSYETRYEQVFAGRSSVEAAQLHELIALRQMELQNACDAVNRTDARLRSLSAAPNSLPDEATLLRSLELIALERRAFVQIARDYNRRIARYVELARPGQIASEQLIGMLIRRTPSATATRPNTSAPSDRRTQTGADGRQTFATNADGWIPADEEGRSNLSTAQRDEFVAPASAETRQIEVGERSLLVAPR